MATEQKINMDQASGGCQTVKFNGNDIKKIILDGKTIWEHKKRTVSSYDAPTFSTYDEYFDWWSLETEGDYYDMSGTYPHLYPNYEYSSSKGIRGTGGRITDRRNVKANTWYYLGGDWYDSILRVKVNFTTTYFGGDTPDTGGTDQDTGEQWYEWVEPRSKVTIETLECKKNYVWTVD